MPEEAVPIVPFPRAGEDTLIPVPVPVPVPSPAPSPVPSPIRKSLVTLTL